VEELKVKTNSENVWYFSTTKSVGKVIMQKRLPSSPPCTHAQKSPLNCRKMLGRILRMVLMKEKLLFKGQ